MSAMATSRDLDAVARTILDANVYVTIASADGDGQPWASPVYYAHEDYRELYWVSCPDATHSRNLAVRPEVSLVVFDSHAAIGRGQAVYVAAEARELDGVELEHAVAVYSRRSVATGVRPWRLADVLDPAPHRLYAAAATALWILDPDAGRDVRVRVHP
jgi:nitroimidazol reductase NimA-like FMN-containing flavoprotein (pyridoxamine 5'-phosphate oxidase superfamily)